MDDVLDMKPLDAAIAQESKEHGKVVLLCIDSLVRVLESEILEADVTRKLSDLAEAARGAVETGRMLHEDRLGELGKSLLNRLEDREPVDFRGAIRALRAECRAIRQELRSVNWTVFGRKRLC